MTSETQVAFVPSGLAALPKADRSSRTSLSIRMAASHRRRQHDFFQTTTSSTSTATKTLRRSPTEPNLSAPSVAFNKVSKIEVDPMTPAISHWLDVAEKTTKKATPVRSARSSWVQAAAAAQATIPVQKEESSVVEMAPGGWKTASMPAPVGGKPMQVTPVIPERFASKASTNQEENKEFVVKKYDTSGAKGGKSPSANLGDALKKAFTLGSGPKSAKAPSSSSSASSNSKTTSSSSDFSPKKQTSSVAKNYTSGVSSSYSSRSTTSLKSFTSSSATPEVAYTGAAMYSSAPAAASVPWDATGHSSDLADSKVSPTRSPIEELFRMMFRKN